ncbi:MAG: VWA domain-containing protein, partial [Treponema sp.]|nr:VWA domain-containing protein [Treponema sp.]
MKKRSLIVLLYFLWALSLVPGQDRGPIDLVVLLDTSSSMSGSYEEVSNYMIGPFLREFLRIGDTFHLISFSTVPRMEISRRIEGVGDVETIIGRILLMYPLDPYSDISTALSYGEQYVSSLPSSRQKKVFLISDGDHSPRPGSASGGGSLQDLIAGTSSRLNRLGAEFRYLSVPLGSQTAGSAPGGAARPPAPASTPAASTPAPTASTPAPAASTPAPAASTPAPAASTPAPAASTP